MELRKRLTGGSRNDGRRSLHNSAGGGGVTQDASLFTHLRGGASNGHEGGDCNLQRKY